MFSALFFPSTISAQDAIGSGSVTVQLTPGSPTPQEEVTAQAVSNLINLDTSPITWLLNGKTQLQGVGKKNFTFTAGEVGSLTSLRVEISTDDFGVITKNIELRPSDVDILWEADTYTPPFYKGKALPTSQSFIKVVGVPFFISKSGKLASNNLLYAWKKTYTMNPNDSGVGKNIYLYRGTYTFNENTIETTVSSADGSLSVSKKTKISIYEPKIIFYEHKPLEGVRYEYSLGGTFDIKEKEITLRAEPYFFSFSNADNNGADFSWNLDGKKLETNPDKKSEFTLRKPENGNGHSGISLKISNSGYDLQSASKNMTFSYSN
jgi:hypothetical protein